MSWKEKEKELTLEEAIELTKEELKPYWFNSKPKIAGIHSETGEIAVPLDPDFTKSPCLILLVDPTDPAGETVFFYAMEMHRRYLALNCTVLVVLYPYYSFLKNPESIKPILSRWEPQFPIVIDHDGVLTRAFRVQAFPKVMLLHGNRCYHERQGRDWLNDLELKLQTFLREKDPGLPLLSIFDPKEKLVRHSERIEFGRQSTLDPRLVQFVGNWVQEEDRRITQDPQASIIFHRPGTRIALVAACVPSGTSGSVSSVTIEVDSTPAYEAIMSEDLFQTEMGQSECKVSKARLYHLLGNLTNQSHEVKLKFHEAHRAPIAVYGLRVGNS